MKNLALETYIIFRYYNVLESHSFLKEFKNKGKKLYIFRNCVSLNYSLNYALWVSFFLILSFKILALELKKKKCSKEK